MIQMLLQKLKSSLNNSNSSRHGLQIWGSLSLRAYIELRAHKYLKGEKNNMKQMLKYNLKHLWQDHKIFLGVVGLVLVIAIVL